MITEMPNNCNNNICYNGGACLLFVATNAFRCVCTVGWTGEICETGLLVIKQVLRIVREKNFLSG